MMSWKVMRKKFYDEQFTVLQDHKLYKGYMNDFFTGHKRETFHNNHLILHLLHNILISCLMYCVILEFHLIIE